MIFGEPVPYDDRYGVYMNDFFNLVNSAYLTCEVTHKKKTYVSVIQFNSYESDTDYRHVLEIKYNKAIIEFEKMIAEVENKQDKLYIITHLIGEFDSFISFINKNAAGIFSHKFFGFKNLSQKKKDQNKILNESICQDYYYWLNNYLEKMKMFLKERKEDAGYMSQNDIINHPSGSEGVNASTKINPLKFFTHLFSPKGLVLLRNEFISSFNEDYFLNTNYDPIREIMSVNYTESETAEIKFLDWPFREYYLNRLSEEFKISLKFINDYIDHQEQESSVIFFIKKTLINLNSLLKVTESDDAIKKYEASSRRIKDLIRYVKEKRSDYTPDKKQIIPYFKVMLGGSKKHTAQLLFDALLEEKHVHSNSKNDFINAFTGSQPAHKIVWTGRIGDLKTFIDYSLEKRLIKESSSKWITTANTFTENGILFNHKRISDTKVTLNKSAIENIINSIINSVQP